MTTEQFCQAAGLSGPEFRKWIDYGVLDVSNEFTADQAEHARLLKALHAKGVALSELARADLAGQAYVVYDGRALRACRDAALAIGVVARAKRSCPLQNPQSRSARREEPSRRSKK
jgi:hypothetical protein